MRKYSINTVILYYIHLYCIDSKMELPENFISVMKDFTNDLRTTFPEHAHRWWVYGDETSEDGWKDLFQYCLKVYPERFFDILYQNEDIFKADSDANVDFLPRVDFKLLYNSEGVSTQTQQTIWKYLQLIMFMVIRNVQDKSQFGNTMNLFEGVDEDELQTKMADALSNLEGFFKNLEKNGEDSDNDDEGAPCDTKTQQEFMDETLKHGEKMMNEMFEQFEKQAKDAGFPMSEDASGNESTEPGQENNTSRGGIPNADDLHSHLKGLFGGKLGRLAQELMEELTEDMQESLGLKEEDLEGSTNPMDVLKRLMRQPDKLMALVKKIQNKFQDKMKAGDLSQEDIMREAGDMLKKMKEMGGNSKQMNEMFQNMAKSMGGSMGKNMKVDTNRIDRMMKQQSMKDRLRAKIEKKKQDGNFILESKEAPGNYVYRPLDGEKQEKSSIAMTDEQINKIAEEIGDISTEPSKPKKASGKKKNAKKKTKK